ncbi:MAG TPA: hypothetical protein VHM92_05250 [Allosphingosinicella sp.]|nr:hypothetical protein [Allosphingosinicella sp.]
MSDSERGKPAGFDPATGEVKGSGSGAGGGGNPSEDYDQDPMAGAGAEPPHGPGGTRHPLPDSDEARHNEIPEGVEAEKGRGDDAKPVAQSGRDAVNPDGEPYRYDDNGRGERFRR